MSVCGSQNSLTSVCNSIRDKTASLKSSNMKEIESWAKEGQEGVTLDCSRHSGQLMDNVTEQRMLNSKLWDLSKERHRFIYQNTFDQKIFLERQSKKSAVLKEMLDGVNKDGSRTSYSSQALRRRASLRGPEKTCARIALLERFDPNRNKKGCKLPKKDSIQTAENNSTECLSSNQSNTGSRYKSAKSVSFGPSSSKAQVIITTPRQIVDIKACWSQMDDLSKEPTKQFKITKAQCIISEEGCFCQDETAGKTMKKDRPPTTAATSTTTSVSYVPTLPKLKRHSSMINPQALNQQRYARSQSAPGLTLPNQDHRYKCLTDLLSDNRTLDRDISELVRNMESLHVPPKRQRSVARPGKRIIQFMQQHGICI